MRGLDLRNQRFGRLLVLADTGKRKSRNIIWQCKCDCGNFKEIRGGSLTFNRTESCGCLHKEQLIERNTTHGDTHRGKVRRLYVTWQAMKRRCSNANGIYYKNYGGRGIKVCPEWISDYSAFKKWALNNGYTDDLTIDRINNDGNYELSNCQWITQSENSKKKEV